MPSDEELLAKFEEMDANGDGVLSRQEIESAFRKLNMPDDLVKKYVQAFDCDGDGKVTKDEYKYKLGISDKRQRQVSYFEKMFREVDTDNSGKVSVQEIQKLLAGINANYDLDVLAQWISKRDQNNDGELDCQEFIDFLQNQL